MPAGLHRTYGAHHLHFITCSCYRRLPFFRAEKARDRFLSILEETRQHYRFVVVGYVVMPEHVHLLLTEPEVGSPSTVMQVVKQCTAQALLPKKKRHNPRQREMFAEEIRRAFWQARFYDFNVWTTKKRIEKLRYMHRNPVKRGLVGAPEQWRWSSYRFYLLGEAGLVKVDEGWGEILSEIKWHKALGEPSLSTASHPPLHKTQGRGTHSFGMGKGESKYEKLGHPL